MTDVFDIRSRGNWNFVAEASTILKTTQLLIPPGVKFVRGVDVKPKHNAQYWAKATAAFDFSDADRVPPDKFNRVVWKGLMGRKPYPVKAGQATSKVDVDD